jgi:hypothetical protein
MAQGGQRLLQSPVGLFRSRSDRLRARAWQAWHRGHHTPNKTSIGIFPTIPAAANAIADAIEALTTIPDFVPRTRDGRSAVINAGNLTGE